MDSIIDPASQAAGLPAKRLNVLLCLSQGRSVAEAAAQAGVHRSSVYNWCREDPAFRAALHSAQAAHAEAVQDELRAISANAVAALKALMTGDTTPASVRLRAAATVIQSVAAANPYRQAVGPAGCTAADTDRWLDAAFSRGVDEKVLRTVLDRLAPQTAADAPAQPPERLRAMAA